MEELIKRQNDLGQALVALIAKRKAATTRNQIEKHQQAVESAYDAFKEGDEDILSQDNLEQNHPYFAERRLILDTHNKFIEECQEYNAPPPINPPKKEVKQGSTTPSTSSIAIAIPPKEAEIIKSTAEKYNPQPTPRYQFEQTPSQFVPPSSASTCITPLQRLLRKQDVAMRLMYRTLDDTHAKLEAGTQSNTYIDIKNRQIRDSLEKIEETHHTLLEETADEDQVIPYFTENYYEVLQERAELALITLQDARSSTKPITATPQALKLPDISLPTFSGEYETWNEFSDMFTKLVHENTQLTNTHKLAHLKAHLRKSAAQLINHLATIGENYERAWEILQARYNNKRLLAASYFNTLLAQHNIQNATAANIRALHDTTVEMLHNISNLRLGNPFESLVTHFLMKKLDSDTRERYESNLPHPQDVPRLDDFLNFLLRRFQSLQTTESYKPSSMRSSKPEPYAPRNVFVNTENKPQRTPTANSTINTCQYCEVGGHAITQCHHFHNITIKRRSDVINRKRLCTNCLLHNNSIRCSAPPACTKCSNRHHTLLHESPPHLEKRVSISTSDANHTTLLSTAMVRSNTINGASTELRALIDPGSQVSLITEEAVHRLGSALHQTTVKIAGIGANKLSTASARVKLSLRPHFPSAYRFNIEAYVLPKITMEVPELPIKRSTSHLNWSRLPLADPNFHIPAPVDILLGADVYSDFIGNKIIKGKPTAIKTSLGWILSGPTQINTISAVVQSHSGTKIESSMNRFWELEEVTGGTAIGSTEELACESIFQKTTRRNTDGRYVVQLPFKEPQSEHLGSSRQRALQRYLQLEKKLDANHEMRELYIKFMAEYHALGHMKLAAPFAGKYYLPHHAIVKKTAESTKIRVVFDASMKTSTGPSLNDTMHVGPPLQAELWAILLKWRKHRIVFSADIQKMYRQINMHENHHPYQTILWREHKHQPLQEYHLTTVTYGTSAAPYLAIRTLHQLADDELQTHPAASHLLKNDFYVDDVLTGADTIEEGQHLQSQLVQLLHKGGMELGKWSSNHPDILKGIPESERLIGDLDFKDEPSIKTLGIHYNPTGDHFLFHVDLPPNPNSLTKRQFLSEMSRIFDPLGWLTPLIVGCKIMYQSLWSLNIGWDDPLPSEFADKWDGLKTELRATQVMQIPRYIQYSKDNCTFELLGFCDASEQAYAAVVYSKIIRQGQVVIRLLTAKSKVAPTKSKLTIPRLELCGASLLSRLIQQVIKVLEINISKITLWSDSTIALAWIKKPSSTWKAFVANRVAEIQTNTDIKSWKHVRSEDNPADCASRGITSKQLASMAIWWDGPKFLSTMEEEQEDETLSPFETTEEMKMTFVSHLQQKEVDSSIQTMIKNQSSFKRLVRITTYLLRWRTKQRGPIQSHEWDQAIAALVRAVQLTTFGEEYQCLEKTKSVRQNSKLQSLYPFLDEEKIIRVGGRLKNSSLPFNEQHPIILPYTGHLTRLILDWGHQETLHGSNALTLAFIRKHFWIIKGVQAVKQNNRQCIRCHRFKVSRSEQLMGALPSPRVTAARPFTHTGVDYAGPIDIRMSKGRGAKSYKGYICLFICLTTKAIHIEAASDLSTEGFISALRRFISRRGNVAHMYSDNGTNFVGANKALQPINWHFIPPTAPHFGGLWEAGIKSIKTHLRKCIGDAKLTFEEMTTLLTQIEACLNSRPLCPLTEDPESLDVLTPGHFLIGDAITAPPDKEHLELKTSLMSRWKVVQNIRTQFWKKWMSDYLHRLQHRPKWHQATPNLTPGDIVLLRDELQAPTRWKLGRVKNIHPGNDGLTRVATLKTADNPNIKRPITKLSRLPIQQPMIDQDVMELSTPKRRQQPIRQAKSTRGSTSTSTRLLQHTCMLLCIMGLASSHPISRPIESAPITITTWNNSGMYFDKVTRVELLATKWKLVIRYNLTSYWQEMRNVERGLEIIEEACKNVRPIKCDLILQQLHWQFNNIIQDNEFLMQNKFNHRRLRRGVGDSIGHILGDMFGILSQREAEQYENQFEQIQVNEDYTLQLLKNQTSILDNTLKLFKHSNNITTQHLQQLLEAQQQFESELAQLNEYRTHQDKALGTILLSVQLGLAIKHLEDTQRGLIDVLLGAQHHIIHPSVLSPLQLEQEISIILKHVTKTTVIPGHGLLELQNLYRLMKVRTRITNANAIIAIELPLVQAWNYQLYEALPVPIFVNNSLTTIHPSTQYILVDQYRERFAPLSHNDRAQCQEIVDDLVLCDIPTLYTRQHGSHTQCEISMFLNLPVLHESCHMTRGPTQNYFIKLHAPNQWIFGVDKPLSVDISCNSITYPTETLIHYGILQLASGCTLRSNDLHLSAVSAKTTNRDGSFIPAFNISTYNSGPSSRKVPHSSVILTTPDTTQLENSINSLKHDESTTLTPHHIHHYVVSHLILGTLLGIGVLLLIRHLCRKRTQTTQDHPRQRVQQVTGESSV